MIREYCEVMLLSVKIKIFCRMYMVDDSFMKSAYACR